MFNKVGDLYLRTGKVQAAVETYERAVAIYEEGGLHNNAIALCNKILRNAPGRTPVYLRLAKLMVQRGFVAEAKQNLLEYAERMQKAGQVDDAFNALKEFADLSPENEEIRLLLAEQLKAAARTDEAQEQLAALYHELEAKGDSKRSRDTLDKIKAINPDFDAGAAAPKPEVKEAVSTSELVFLDLDETVPPVEEPAAPVAEAVAPPPEPAPEEPVEALDIEPTAVVEEPEPPQPVEPIELERGSADYLAMEEPVEAMSGLEVGDQFEAPAPDEVAELEIEPTDLAGPLDGAPAEVATEDMERTSEGFVPPDAMIEPPLEDLAPAAVEPEVAEEEDERVSEGFVPPDAMIEPPAEVVEPEIAAAPKPERGPRPEPRRKPKPKPEPEPVAPVAEGDGELEVPDLDLSGHMSDEEAAATATEAAQPPRSTGDPGFHSPQVRTLDMSAWDTPLPGAESLDTQEAVAEPVAEPPAPAAPPGLDQILDQVADDPNNPDLHRSLGEMLLEQGERERGVEELDIALEIYQMNEDWRAAEGLAEEILRIEPNSVRHHQNLVEFAFRRGDKDRLAEAYLGLADGLFRTGAAERARAVYQRVLEHDPGNERALLGLQTLEPAVEEAPVPAAPAAEVAEEPAAAAPGSDFVDLGALVLDEDVAVPVRDTRMRIEEEEPTGDEQKDFEEMLGQFKKGIEQNVDEEDWQAHYDLGIAFKEMGLLDEAISSFQKALRSAEGRLRAAEALGLCFFEKGQFSVAATVLRRAVETGRSGDDGMIGLLYWLGRCEEEQSRVSEALAHYQRVFAIDINFQDVSDRVKQLAKAGG